jgi:hypothetical protein
MSTENLTDSFKYTVPEEGFTNFNGLLMHSNEYMQGGFGFGVLFIVFAVSFHRLSRYPNSDALTASGFITFLTSAFMSLIGVLNPAITVLLFLITTGVVAHNLTQRR